MGGTARRATIAHVPALDGLRGAAVAGVLLFHGGHLTGGFLGVDLFFVLSGFLITSLLLAESADTQTVSLGGFWARRARRLLPALGGMLVGVALYCAFIASPNELAQIRGDALATIAYVANWRAVFTGHDYWALFRSPSPLEHTWSLAIEEQFYVLFPLLFVGLLAWWRRATPRALLVTALGLAAGSVLLMAVLYDPTDASRVYYGTDTRAAAILLGVALAAALAVWGPVQGHRARIALETTGIAGIAWLAYTWTQTSGDDPFLYRGGFLLCALAVIAVIAAAAHPEAGPISHALAWKPLRLLGLISYGVYLWHWPIDVVVDPDRTGLTGWPLFTLQTLITLAIAITSYHLLERPIRRGALTARQWTLLTPATAIALTALILTTTTGAHPDVATATQHGPGRSIEVPTRRDLFFQKLAIDARVPPARPRVLVAGDSQALSLAQNAPRDTSAPFGVATAALLGCGITPGTPVGAPYATPERVCRRWPELWSDALTVFHPQVVLLLTGAWDVYERRVDGTTVAWGSPRLDRAQVVEAARVAKRGGAHLVVLSTPCFAPDATESELTSTRLADAARVHWLNGVLRSASRDAPGTTFVDLARYVCPDGRTPGDRSGRPLRSDGVHFTPTGARAVWAWLTPSIRSAISRRS
jgi:peptidoglycan/LPS O-acetylase OafA/YrhL